MDPVLRFGNAKGKSKLRLVVVMGVSGSGKSTIGERAAERLGVSFLDADHLHPPANVAKMKGGTPLEDTDRWPWLAEVAREMVELADRDGRVFCACSALKRAYRDFLLKHTGEPILFVLLHGDRETIARRQANRPGHFMPPTLLDSQFKTLEPFAPDENGLVLDVSDPPERLVDAIAAVLEAP